MKISELKTPCYVIDEGKLTENLKILHHVMQRTGAKILLAQKAFSAFCESPDWKIFKRDDGKRAV